MANKAQSIEHGWISKAAATLMAGGRRSLGRMERDGIVRVQVNDRQHRSYWAPDIIDASTGEQLAIEFPEPVNDASAVARKARRQPRRGRDRGVTATEFEAAKADLLQRLG